MRPTSDLDRLRAEYADRDRRLSDSNLYSPFNASNLFIYQQRQRAVLGLLKRHGFENLNERLILELGCGRGGVLAEYLGFGAAPERLFGVDLLPDRVRAAYGRLHLPLVCADGQHLPYPRNSFDLVLQYTVFTSLLDNEIKAALAKEILRVVRRPGMILWYDFWFNPTNPQTRGIQPSEIRRLFPGCKFDFQRITLAPPLARALVPVSWLFAALLERLTVFNSHYLVAICPHA
jgi:SAM-dependent methyltransferase